MEADSPGHNQFNHFEDLIHQKDDSEDHQTDKKDRKGLFENI